MNRDSRNLRGSTVNPASRWRIVFIALLLALAIRGASQISPVQAAPAGDTDIEFIFISLKTLRPVCVGDKEEINVYLHRRLDDARFDNTLGSTRQAVPGISIKAAMADGPIIGKISPTQKNTENLSGGAEFIFLAENPGESAITFEATVTRGWFGTNWGNDTISGIIYHPIKVINCKFKVTTVQQAIVAGGGNFNIVAMLDEVEITGDEQGHFTGTTPVNWVGASSSLGICSASINVAATTQAHLTADMDESGQLLTGSISIEAPETTVTATCVGVSNTSPMSLSADPLIFSVPSSGGVVKVAQGFVFDTANMPGSAVIVVIPVESEAAAFSPDSRAALAPLEWWSRLWHNFPWAYSALLGLR